MGDKIICFGLMLYSFFILVSVAAANIALGFILIGLIIKKIKEKSFKFESTNLDLAILIYFLANIISIIFSRNFSFSLGELSTIMQFILIYYVVVNSINNIWIIKRMVAMMMLSVVFSSIYSIYQYYALGITRASGYLPTLVSESVLLLVLPIAITHLFLELSMRKRLAITVSIVLGVLNLLFSNTRGAWLGIIGASFFLAVIKKKRLIIYILIVVTIVLSIYPAFYQRAMTIVDISSHSNSQRIFMWRSAFNMFKDNPLSGVGLDMFSELYVDDYILPGARVKSWRYAHSIVMNQLAELGVLGLGAFLLLVFEIIKSGIKLSRANDYYKANIGLGLTIGIIGFLIHGLTFYNIGVSHSAKSFWFIVGLLMALYNLNFKENDSRGN